MGDVLGIILVIVAIGYLGDRVRVARDRAWGGPRTAGMRSRASASRSRGGGRTRTAGARTARPTVRHIREQAKADAYRMWHKARSLNWLEEQRQERKAAQAVTTAGGPPRAPRPASPGAAPAPPPQEPPSPPSPDTGGTMPASTASAEDLIAAIDAMAARAASGNIHAKRGAILQMHEAAERFSAALAMIARHMSEPGSNYGPEITEPIAQAATHQQASAMALAEADANLSALMRRSIAEQAASGTQTPHHQNELTESGAR